MPNRFKFLARISHCLNFSLPPKSFWGKEFDCYPFRLNALPGAFPLCFYLIAGIRAKSLNDFKLTKFASKIRNFGKIKYDDRILEKKCLEDGKWMLTRGSIVKVEDMGRGRFNGRFWNLNYVPFNWIKEEHNGFAPKFRGIGGVRKKSVN